MWAEMASTELLKRRESGPQAPPGHCPDDKDLDLGDHRPTPLIGERGGDQNQRTHGNHDRKDESIGVRIRGLGLGGRRLCRSFLLS